jgi:hypothetical protein
MSRVAGARVAGSAFAESFRNLAGGDPTAIGLTILFPVLFALVGGVFLYDRMGQGKEGRGKPRAR